MRNPEDVTITTLSVREIGPYEGRRIAGTSHDVVNAVLTKEYRFADEITIRVVEIPARLDRATGRTYLSGADGIKLMADVRRYLAMLRVNRSREIRSEIRVPVDLELSAPRQLAA